MSCRLKCAGALLHRTTDVGHVDYLSPGDHHAHRTLRARLPKFGLWQPTVGMKMTKLRSVTRGAGDWETPSSFGLWMPASGRTSSSTSTQPSS
eukprot:476435-Hanusia_phi.AAC.3